MIVRIYEILTGKPWTTVRSAAAEFGPPPGAVYATQLAVYTDAELIAHTGHLGELVAHADQILTRHREREAVIAWLQLGPREKADTYWTPLPSCGCPIGVVVDGGHQEGCHGTASPELAASTDRRSITATNPRWWSHEFPK
jgi:hypothetical protein